MFEKVWNFWGVTLVGVFGARTTAGGGMYTNSGGAMEVVCW